MKLSLRLSLWLALGAITTLPGGSTVARRSPAAGHANPPAIAAIAGGSRAGIAPSRTYEISFVRDGAIWLAGRDGSNQRKIILNAEAPAWSPDGSRVAFARSNNLYIAAADGKNVRQVTQFAKDLGPGFEITAAFESTAPVDITWHPKGRWVAFSRRDQFYLTRKGLEPPGVFNPDPKRAILSNIYLAQVEPTGDWWDLMLWIGNTNSGFGDVCISSSAHPAYAPGGERIAFVRNGDIWLATLNEQPAPDEDLRQSAGGNWDWDEERVASVGRLAGRYTGHDNSCAGAGHLSWSPDGKCIAYEIRRYFGSGIEEVWLLNLDDGSTRLLSGYATDPAISPDGTFIAWRGLRPGGYQVGGVVIRHLANLVATAPVLNITRIEDSPAPSDSRALAPGETFIENAQQPAWRPRPTPEPVNTEGERNELRQILIAGGIPVVAQGGNP